MKYKLLAAILFTTALLKTTKPILKEATGEKEVLGAETETDLNYQPTVPHTKLKTETAFNQREETINKTIPFDTKYIKDKDLPYGQKKVIENGKNGIETQTFLITYWKDYEIDKVLIDTYTTKPRAETIAVGTKIIWKKIDTPDLGKIDYWGKLKVFATKYDSTCIGCNNTTALGAPVQEGVCAVDPKVIPMYTHFYVPGYGKCQALDVGGLIKGNRIDLAFKDARTSPWGAKDVEIYLMDNTPKQE